MPATFSSICSRESSVRSCDFAARVANHPGAAADNRDRRVTESLQPRQRHDRSAATRRGGSTRSGSNPMYAVTRSRREQLREAVGRVVHQPAPGELVVEIGHDADVTIAVDAISRRAVLKSPRRPASARWQVRRRTDTSTSVTARSDARDVPVDGLPPALAGFRIGFLTDVHRSRWVSHDDVARAVALLMNRAARSHRPGRRLRDVGRSALRPALGRGARAAVGAARRLRHPRQSRRRPRHARGAGRAAACRC